MKILSELKERAAMRRLTGAVLATAVFGCAMGSVYAAEETTAAAEEKAAAAAEEPIDEYTLSETVVTAERIPTERMNTPANISVITDKDIAANHYTDVTEALSQVNGVVVSKYGSFDGVTLNGDERVVVMVDGRRLNNDQGLPDGKGSIDLKMIPTLKNIDRIEIIKGGASALYGSDAVGGVINIITKRGSRKPETTLDVNMGSWGTYNYEIATQGSDNDFSWFVSGGIQKQNHARYKMHGESHDAPQSDKDDNSFVLRLDQNLDKSSSVRLNFEHKTKHDGTYYNAVNHNARPDYKREENYNNAAVSYHFKEDKKTPGYVRLFNNYRGSYQGEGKFNTKLYGLDYQNGWELGEHTVVVGAEWHESRSSNLDHGYSNEGLRNIAGYVQDTWKIGDKWSFVPGIRLDHHNRYGSHWSPSIAVNYRATKNTQFYASWGRVFHAPTSDDLFWNQPSWMLYGNPNLKAETGHTETIGLNHRFDDATSVGFSVFQSKLHDAITWPYDPVTMETRAANTRLEKRRGLDLTVNRRISPIWDLDIGYSYVRIEQSDKTGALVYYGKNRNPNGYHFGLKYHQGSWKAGLYGTYTTGLETSKYMLSRHAALIDFNVSYEVNDATTIYFKALNLTNQEYSTYAGDYGYHPGNCRFFQLGVTYTF